VFNLRTLIPYYGAVCIECRAPIEKRPNAVMYELEIGVPDLPDVHKYHYCQACMELLGNGIIDFGKTVSRFGHCEMYILNGGKKR